MSPITLLSVVPILRIFDIAKAKEFYVGYLGFTWDWEHRFDDNAPLYAQVSRSGVILHLSEHHGDGAPGVSLFIRMTGIEVFHAELQAKNYKYMRPGLDDAFWGSRIVSVIDPFGNRLRFDERKAAAGSSDQGVRGRTTMPSRSA